MYIKKYFYIILLFSLCFIANANNSSKNEENHNWTPIQISAYYDLIKNPVDVYGLNINLFFSEFNNIYGLSISPTSNSGDAIYGVECNFVTLPDYRSINHGVVLSLLNLCFIGETPQPGIYTGILNYTANVDGSIGIANIGDATCQVGISNIANDKAKVQIGAFNINSQGLQFGLVNYNKNSIIPLTLFFNYSSN